jgi:hypothetical protein
MKKFYISLLVILFSFPIFAQNSGITVVTPNGGENWIIGCPSTIQWITASPVTTGVKIELFKNGVFCMTICNQVPAAQNSFVWTPPYSVAPGNTFKVKVSLLTSSAGFDFSNNNFSINMGSITVVSPNGGEIWNVGSTHQILWTDNICENVRIELWKGGAYNSLICASTPSTGSFTWTIPPIPAATSGNDYKVKIMSIGLNSGTTVAVYDFSNSNFTITSGSFIIVTSPNGGEGWARGSTHIITWQDNIPQNVRIELWKGGVFQSLIAYSVPSNGSCYWAIPATQPLGSDYKVKILALSSNATNTLFDFSDNNFSILGPTNSPSVKNSESSDLSEGEFRLFPNPCRDQAHVRTPASLTFPVSVEIMNYAGKIVLNQGFDDPAIPVEISVKTDNLANGMYIFVIRQEGKIIFRTAMMVQR